MTYVEPAPFRWSASIRYEVDGNTFDHVYHFDNLGELSNLIEEGPDFSKITSFRIEYMLGKDDAS